MQNYETREEMDAADENDLYLMGGTTVIATVLYLTSFLPWWMYLAYYLCFMIPGFFLAKLHRQHLHDMHIEFETKQAIKTPRPRFYNRTYSLRTGGPDDNFTRFCEGHEDVVLLEVMRFIGSNVKRVRCTCRKLCRSITSLRPLRTSLYEFELRVGGHYPMLQSLDLSFSEGLTPDSLRTVLRNFPALRQLKLTSVATDALLEVVVSECKVLEAIDLSGALNLVSDIGLAALGNCDKLNDLNLTQCWTVSDKGLTALVDKRALQMRRLVLRNNFWVTNDTVYIITRCTGLRVLDLSSGKPSPHLPPLKGTACDTHATQPSHSIQPLRIR
jgi:hypothetical protein